MNVLYFFVTTVCVCARVQKLQSQLIRFLRRGQEGWWLRALASEVALGGLTCSPTSTSTILRPFPPLRALGRKRLGEKEEMSAVTAAPSMMSSDINFPDTGPHKMPQQLCPALM